MLIKENKIWDIPEHLATPESDYLNRRQLVKAAGLAALSAGASSLLPSMAFAQSDPTMDLYPAKRNEAYKLDRGLTPEEINSKYNNFYEFGSHKQIYTKAQDLKTRPWEILIDGLVEKPFTIGFDDLVRKVQLEERLYRHRCVEAWSMTIPWTGFQMSELVKLAKPMSNAKFIRMETFHDPKMASGQKQAWYPWPYVECLTMQEANNDLAFLVTGAYGKPAAKQFGAPLRLALPWKYGFKSIKSIVKFSFVEEMPKSFWEQLSGTEYGFWANVNPKYPHPRWSQETERVLQTGKRVPTLIYNGYGEQVASMYSGLKGRTAFY